MAAAEAVSAVRRAWADADIQMLKLNSVQTHPSYQCPLYSHERDSSVRCSNYLYSHSLTQGRPQTRRKAEPSQSTLLAGAGSLSS